MWKHLDLPFWHMQFSSFWWLLWMNIQEANKMQKHTTTRESVQFIRCNNCIIKTMRWNEFLHPRILRSYFELTESPRLDISVDKYLKVRIFLGRREDKVYHLKEDYVYSESKLNETAIWRYYSLLVYNCLKRYFY